MTYSGHQKCEGSHRWGKGIRQQFILHLIVSGKGTFVTESGTFRLSAGDIFLIRPFSEIEYYADSLEPWEYFWVNFTGTDAASILSLTDFSENSPVISGCGNEIINTMKAIASNEGKASSDSIELTGLLYILLSQLVRISSKKSKLSRKELEHLHCIKAAEEYIAANYPLPISVEDIAAAAGVSRTTLFRLFRTELNTTPADFLIDFRINQAKKLLSSTDISVTAVARSAGYEDNLYFSRAFRRITGMSPTEFRKSEFCNKNPY